MKSPESTQSKQFPGVDGVQQLSIASTMNLQEHFDRGDLDSREDGLVYLTALTDTCHVYISVLFHHS